MSQWTKSSRENTRSQDKESDDTGVKARRQMAPEVFGYGPEIMSRSQDRESDESTDDTRSPEFFGAS